ncbi:MAG: hypothetical protein H6825_11610 [Planctomycetes bacterium]|nr:hypothetical protein [Planctomycetota bacterium]
MSIAALTRPSSSVARSVVAPVALLVAFDAGSDGRWTPGIGDPTVIGWVTVVAYLVAGVLALGARTRARDAGLARLLRFWTVLTALLFALGVNKQLDLQSLFTQVGRDLAKAQGWYDERGTVQVDFILGLVAVVGLALLGTLWFLRRALARVRLAFAGTVFLCTFIVVRAASFHHMDVLLQWEFLHVRMNWVLELGGIALVALGAWRFRPEVPSATPSPGEPRV